MKNNQFKCKTRAENALEKRPLNHSTDCDSWKVDVEPETPSFLSNKMLRIIIRSSIVAPDILIDGDTSQQLNDALETFLTLVRTESSLVYLKDEYLFLRLLECMTRVSGTPFGLCPLIFDSWS